MDINQFVEELRRDLSASVQAGSEEIRSAAERLSMALDSSVRLTLMDALSQAASEITTELNGTSVEVRLKGREPIFVVVGAPPAPPEQPEAPQAPEGMDDDFAFDDEPVARITLRLPESLKQRAEELAARRGQSLNTWLVNATRTAASGISINVNAPGFGPGAPGRNRSSNKRIQGWVR